MPSNEIFFCKEKNGKLFFLDEEVFQEGNKFVTTVYCKPTFSGDYKHFNSFLPTTYIWYDLYFDFQIFFNLFQLN